MELTVDDDVLLLVTLVQSVSQSCRGGLIDHTHHIETRDCTSILRSSPLSVVEVRRDCDDGVGDLLAQISFSDFLHLAEYHGGDFFGGEGLLLALHFDADTWLPALVDHLEGEVL